MTPQVYSRPKEQGRRGEDGPVTMTFKGEMLPVGDAAVIAVLSETIDEKVVHDVWALHAALHRALGANVLDIVPAYGSVLVRFDPSETQIATIMATIRGALEAATSTAEPLLRSIDVGVCFSTEYGLDLQDSANQFDTSAEELVSEFCRPTYRVAFLGFTAGFPYMLGLPPALNLPRLPTPRARVPAGSVAFAAGQCGIYPRSSPGGWRILGRTCAPVFDVSRESPALFRPGDSVRFHAVSSLDDALAFIHS